MLRAALLVMCVVLVLSGASDAVEATTPDDFGVDRWYEITLDDRTVGWIHAERREAGERRQETIETRLEIRRGGRPVVYHVRRTLGITGDELSFTEFSPNTPGTRPRTTRAVWEPSWLLPWDVEKAIAEHIRRGASGPLEITGLASANAAAPHRLHFSDWVQESNSIWTATLRADEDRSTESYRGDGTLERTTLTLGGLALTISRVASRPVIDSDQQVDLTTAVAVPIRGPMDRLRSAERVEYRVHALDSDSLVKPMETRHQDVEVIADGSLLLRVGSDPRERGDPPPDDLMTKPTPLLNANDPRVRALRARFLRRVGDDQAVRAEALRLAVHRYVTRKDLGVVLDDAATVARTRRGDCTEHAVLLGALLRADGIPSRLVSGLILDTEQDAMLYHMWTQAWIDGAWHCLDATHGQTDNATPRRIALAADHGGPRGSGRQSSVLSSFIGRIRIDATVIGETP